MLSACSERAALVEHARVAHLHAAFGAQVGTVALVHNQERDARGHEPTWLQGFGHKIGRAADSGCLGEAGQACLVREDPAGGFDGQDVEHGDNRAQGPKWRVCEV